MKGSFIFFFDSIGLNLSIGQKPNIIIKYPIINILSLTPFQTKKRASTSCILNNRFIKPTSSSWIHHHRHNVQRCWLLIRTRSCQNKVSTRVLIHPVWRSWRQCMNVWRIHLNTWQHHPWQRWISYPIVLWQILQQSIRREFDVVWKRARSRHNSGR